MISTQRTLDGTPRTQQERDGMRHFWNRWGAMRQRQQTHVDLTLSPRANNALRSSMVTPKVTRMIPIDVAHLNYINTEEVACQGIRNVRPCSKGTGETFVSMTVIHKKQGVASSVRVYECIKGLYSLLHKADPSVQLNPLYEVEEDDAIKFLPIGDPSALPLDMIGLGNCVQIGNAYTMSPAFSTNDVSLPTSPSLAIVQ